MTEELPTPKRRKWPSAQDHWTIYEVPAAKGANVGEVLRRWGINQERITERESKLA